MNNYEITEKQRIRENHISELERRGIEPTQENIDKLIIELEETIRKIDSEKETINTTEKLETSPQKWGEEREIEKNKAAHKLSDEIFCIKDSLEKADFLTSDVVIDFFSKYDPNNEDDLLSIRFEFNRFNLLSQIASDLLYKALKEMEKLEQRIIKVSKGK